MNTRIQNSLDDAGATSCLARTRARRRASAHHVPQVLITDVRQYLRGPGGRLNSGERDGEGRFRIKSGMSSLNAPARPTGGVQLMDPTKAISLNVVKRAADAPKDKARPDIYSPPPHLRSILNHCFLS
jgi:hypothetical protein